MAPHNANGRAKMECSHLIISSVTRRLCRTGISRIVKQEATKGSLRDVPGYQRNESAKLPQVRLRVPVAHMNELELLRFGWANGNHHASARGQLRNQCRRNLLGSCRHEDR